MPKLASTVLGLRDPDTDRTVSFVAGQDVPEWVRDQVTNPAAWDETVAEASASGYPVDGTIDEVEAWVKEDPAARVQEALDVERNRQKPRSTLVSSLEALADQ